ncbi:MAG: sugar phosphate isomerase/epimerase family protein [Candidatus Bathyarchaeia archaeon]
MKIGYMNDPTFPLTKELEWISNHNFDFVDLTLEPPEAYKLNLREVRRKLKDSGLEAVGHTNPFLPAIHPLGAIRKTCLKELERCVKIFSKLNITLMNIHPYDYGFFMTLEEKVKANVELLSRVHDMCAEFNVMPMLENGKPLDTPEAFQSVLDEIPDFMVHLDLGHTNLAPKNLAEAFFKRFKDRIAHIHVSDNKGDRDEHLPLGCGNIDWREMVRLMKSHGYDGTITLEIFSKEREYVLTSRRILERLWRDTV